MPLAQLGIPAFFPARGHGWSSSLTAPSAASHGAAGTERLSAAPGASSCGGGGGSAKRSRSVLPKGASLLTQPCSHARKGGWLISTSSALRSRKQSETCSLPCPLFKEMHCAHRLKSESWLNLNSLFWSAAYLVCCFLIHLPSSFLRVQAREREVWLKVVLSLSEPSSAARSLPAACRRLRNVPLTALRKTGHCRDFPLKLGSPSPAYINVQRED